MNCFSSQHFVTEQSRFLRKGLISCPRGPTVCAWSTRRTKHHVKRAVLEIPCHINNTNIIRKALGRWRGWTITPRLFAGLALDLTGVQQRATTLLALFCLTIQLGLAPPSLAVIAAAEPDVDTFENVPSQLSSAGVAPAVPLSSVVSGPKRREIEGCTRKCVPTCIRGGEGAPGLGPISVRKEIVVFKEGFRSRQYCLSECAQVCALSFDKDKAAQLLPAQ